MIQYYMYKIIRKDGFDLFAFTDKKKYAKKFEKQRNMNLFRKKKAYLSSGQIEFLLGNYPECDLVNLNIDIFNEKDDSSFKEEFIITKSENMEFTNKSVMADINIYTHCWIPPMIFKKDIREALYTLGYCDLYRKISNNKYDKNRDYSEYISYLNNDLDNRQKAIFFNIMKNDFGSNKEIFKVNEYGILFDIIGDTLNETL